MIGVGWVVGVVVGWLVRVRRVGGGGIYLVCGYGDYWCVLFYVWTKCGEVWVSLRLCVLGEGFHSLHWKMLSWLVFVGYMRLLRFRWEWIVCFSRG